MHVCFVNMPIEFYSPVSGGAISTIMMQAAKGLLRRGHEVMVLTPVDSNETYPVGRVVPLRIGQREEMSFVARQWSRIRGRLQGWDWPYYDVYLRSFSQALRALKPAPDVTCVFNDLVTQNYVRKVCPTARRLVWLQNECRTRHSDMAGALSAIDGFLTCSSYIAQWAKRQFVISDEKIAVANSGVDLEQFTPSENGRPHGGPLRVLFLGRIDPNKGPDLVADAVAKLQEEGLAIELTMAGGTWFYRRGADAEEPFFETLREKVKRTGGKLLGHVVRADVPALFRSHDVACVLSRSNEPFGLVVLEAMASGCAVIASNRGGLPEAAGGAAALLNPDDFSSVVDTLRRFATDRDCLVRYKRQSLERASRASWESTVDVFERVCRGTT